MLEAELLELSAQQLGIGHDAVIIANALLAVTDAGGFSSGLAPPGGGRYSLPWDPAQPLYATVRDPWGKNHREQQI